MLEIEETITWKTNFAILDNRTHSFEPIQSNLKLVSAKTVIISIFFHEHPLITWMVRAAKKT